VLPVENDTDSESLTPASTFASTPLVGVIEPAIEDAAAARCRARLSDAGGSFGVL